MKRGAAASEPSNADLVHEVLRSAERPLTFDEITERVNERRAVTTAKPAGDDSKCAVAGPTVGQPGRRSLRLSSPLDRRQPTSAAADRKEACQPPVGLSG